MTVLIPNRLTLTSQGATAKPGRRLLVLSDIAAPGFRGGRFQVCHYSEGACGTSGPPALDQVIVFARELHCLLEEEGSHVDVRHSDWDREFAAVLVGAFLVLARGWSASQVCSRMREESRLTFPCSWCRPGSMRVRACWEGLQVARELGWVLPSVLLDPAECSHVASEFWTTITHYDGSWLVPGKIFVMADPVTVIRDPNPGTCSELLPRVDGSASECGYQMGQDCLPPGSLADSDEEDASTDVRTASRDTHAQRSGSKESFSSVESVCKGFTANWPHMAESLGSMSTNLPHGGSQPEEEQEAVGHDPKDDALCQPQPLPLVTFFRQQGISFVVRANQSDEPGLAELGGSYRAEVLEQHGVRHAEVPVKDTRGAVPSEEAIREFLDVVARMGFDAAGQGAVGAFAVHCKSGFGRSVMLVCILLIYLHDVPGSALMAWSRIVRPGAVISEEEETLLLKLSGRAAVLRHCGAPLLHEEHGPASPACGCCIQ